MVVELAWQQWLRHLGSPSNPMPPVEARALQQLACLAAGEAAGLRGANRWWWWGWWWWWRLCLDGASAGGGVDVLI